jgi:D-hexose-6-phosphate mutarotase
MSTIDLLTFKERLATLQTLNDDFGIAHYLEFKAGRDGVAVAEITNDHAVATISLQGGQVMTFRPRDQDQVLWLSKFAPLDKAKPIRGGIPLCWPWFGPHETDKNKPAHGFARNVLWKVVETTRIDKGITQLTLELINTPETRAVWPFFAQLQLIVTVGSELRIELVTHNLGEESLRLGEALHTYFQISDVRQVAIHGLENCEYLDKVANSQRQRQAGAVTINGPTDRVYLNTTADCIIEDPGLKRRIRIAKEGSHSTVIWNPWEDQAARLGDCGYQGYLGMVCVETVNAAENMVTVKPGKKHRLQAVISVESL